MSPLRVALIDNYDSYTNNLAHLLALANHNLPPTIILADAYPSLRDLHRHHDPFDAYVLSPGPGTPTNPSDFPPLQQHILSSRHPVFAVCLGHQALCHMHNFSVTTLSTIPAHGIISTISLTPHAQHCPLFRGMPPTFSAVRYHSLVAVPSSNTPSQLLPTAWTHHPHPEFKPHRVLMAVTHPSRPHFGVQFHPESVSSQHGSLLASNFVQLANRLRTAVSPITHIPTPSPSLQSSIQQTVAKERAPRFKSLVSRISPQHRIPSYPVFASLFSHLPGAFWLDSSSADAHSAQLSRCSSPASLLDVHSQQHPEPLEDIPTHSQQANSRFSVMGACIGQLAEIVTYNVSDRVVSIFTPSTSQHSQFEGTIFDYLQAQLRQRRAALPSILPCEMNGGYVGYLGYEVKLDVPGVLENRHKSSLPDAWLVFADRLLVFDHAEEDIYMVALIDEDIPSQQREAAEWLQQTERHLAHFEEDGDLDQTITERRPLDAKDDCPLLSFTPERTRSQYLADIEKCLHAIKKGDSYEVCLTNRLQTAVDDAQEIDALQLFRTLRTMNTAPYSAFLQISEDQAICCTSPERFLTIDSKNNVESKPIKGTRPRGRSFAEDEQLRSELEQSTKDRSENLMIVDLVRNDLSRTCDVGTVQVPRLMHVESYATVHQLVSNVVGKLSEGRDVMDCVRAAYPMGSMTGAPKIRTMEIIDSLERSARGVYSGTVGFLSVCGAADLNVVIRTAVVQGSEVSIGVGGAIVAMSDPAEEYDETILKGKAIMQAVALLVTGRSDCYEVAHELEMDDL